jgi:hypothetical protein
MVKFKAEYKHLEVIAIGKRIPYYLNRHVILLLRVHSVPDSVFIDMQQSMLNDLDQMLIDPEKAMDMVPRLSGSSSSTSGALMHMLHSGLDPRFDPFLLSCLHAIRSHHLMNLRKKTRIFVKKGAVLLGGIDETGNLPEDCVFVQISDGYSRDGDVSGSGDVQRPLTGPVLVTKHPVMHPGDVRMLMAVNIPELQHHRNMIMFSQHGRRPEPHKMAGSDLDGDQFAVTWDSRLFLGTLNSPRNKAVPVQEVRMANARPMDYDDVDGDDPSPHREPPQDFSPQSIIQVIKFMTLVDGDNPSTHHESQILETPLQERSLQAINQQLSDHFINFARNDNLGRLSNMWLDYAAKEGADSENCLALAKLSSIAVDFPKSGVPAVVPASLRIPHGTPRPHWREVNEKNSYRCKTVVGVLYDETHERLGRDKELISGLPSLAGRKVDSYGQISCHLQDKKNGRAYLSLIYEPQIAEKLGMSSEVAIYNMEHQDRSESLFGIANEDRFEYDTDLKRLMNKNRLHSEGELVTGCIRKYHRLNKRRQHDVSEEIRRQGRELRKEYRSRFFLRVMGLTIPEVDVALDDEQGYVSLVERLVLEKVKGDDEQAECLYSFQPDEVSVLKRNAFKLAAAYYMVTYSADLQEWNRRDGCVLFSFPWIVADVIAQGLGESAVRMAVEQSSEPSDRSLEEDYYTNVA